MRRHERPSGREYFRICKTPTLRHIALSCDYLHEAANIFVLYTLSISLGFNDFIWRGAVRAFARAAAAAAQVLCQQVLRRPEPRECVRLPRAAPTSQSTYAAAARADPD